MNLAHDVATTNWPDAAALIGIFVCVAWVLVTLIKRVKK